MSTDDNTDDPWARLEAARARHAIRSPFNRERPARTAPPPVPDDDLDLDSDLGAQVDPEPNPAPTRARARPEPAFTAEQRTELRRLATAPDATATALATALDTTPARVRRWAKTEGITLADGRSNAGRKAAWDIDLACNLAHQGQTVQEIAPQVGATVPTVRRGLARRKVPVVDGRAKHSGRSNPVTKALAALDTESLAEAYDRHGSVLGVAAELGLPLSTTNRLLKARGIAVRSAREVQTGRPGEDRAGPLRDLMEANGVTSTQVRTWAQGQGHDVPAVGVPSRSLVEDYLLAHPLCRRSAS